MKNILFLLLFPLASFGNDYNYNKVISVSKGSDAFGFDHVKTSDNGGKIELQENVVLIDGKEYELKSSETSNLYKSKNCSFEFVYKSGDLAMVKLYRYNKVVCYVIGNNAATTEFVTKK